MHRDPLLKLIFDYGRRYPEESATVGRFLEFVESQPDCFQRSLAIGHLTGAAWLVNAKGDSVLLTHHRKLEKWLQPGGHADGETDIFKVAKTEADEETGLRPIEPIVDQIFDLDIHTIPARKNEPEHEHFDVRFAFRHCGSGEFTVSHESIDLAWVPLEKLSEYTTEESIERMARKYRSLHDQAA
ncbi:MAG: NUDIX hydrolase [Verrucomicrobiales bacterium]|nr:NUDIX hydrolase [Verrucomicrobiales bacterium]